MNLEYIDLFDVLDVCSKYLSSPEDDQCIKNFEEMKASIIIRPYLPLEQKETIFEKTIKDIKMIDDRLFVYTSMVEISLTFNALLAYTNIDSDIVDGIKDYPFYDLLWASGICDHILEYCERDYNHLKEMVYQMLSYQNLFVLVDELRSVDTKSIEDLTSEFKRFRIETDPESLKALGNIAIHSDPIIKTIKETIDAEAIKVAKDSGDTE